MPVQITPGSGASIATDSVTVDGAVAELQRVKVMYGADGVASEVAEATPLPVQLVPGGSAGTAAIGIDSGALASGLVVKSSAGVLYGFSGVSTRTSAQYVCVWNTSAAAGAGIAPDIVVYVPAAAAGGAVNFSWTPGPHGWHFATGIYVGNSTTLATRTAGAADCWFQALYE